MRPGAKTGEKALSKTDLKKLPSWKFSGKSGCAKSWTNIMSGEPGSKVFCRPGHNRPARDLSAFDKLQKSLLY